MRDFAQDIRYGCRTLLKSPGFTVVAVLSLALGIGASTAIFSLVNDVLLRSLPVKSPGELVLFRTIEGPQGSLSRGGENNGSIDPLTGRRASTSFSLLTFERFRAQSSELADVFAFAPFNRIQLVVDGAAETGVLGQLVSGNYHTALGVPAVLGRTFLPEDDTPSAPAVAVISYRFWETRFGRSPSILGQVIYVNKVPVTIVGVTAPGFAGAMQVGESAGITVPLAHYLQFQPDRSGRRQASYWWIRLMGRLAPGVTPAQARARLEPILQETAREGWLAGQSLDPSVSGSVPEAPTLAADPGGQGENDRRRQAAQSLRLLLGLAGLVLLAACANVANLLFARGAARRREIALRLALGASRARIVRQLLAESLLLAFLGAAVGTLFAYWSRGPLLMLPQFGGAAMVLDLPIDGRVLGFTSAIAATTALLCGLVPALRATRLNLTAEFQGGARQLGSGARSRLSSALMVVQIALSLVLLVSTGLFVRTLHNLKNANPGFDSRALIGFRLDAQAAGYAPERFAALHAQVQERLARIPGVQAATFSRVALLAGVRSNRRISVPGYTPAQGVNMIVNVNGLAPNFFSALEIPLVLGRDFTDHDSATAPRVAVVSQSFARTFFGTENPVGRHFGTGTFPQPGSIDIEIVGVARDAKYTSLRESSLITFYVPAAQMPEGTANYLVRAAANPATISAAIRAAMREIDPELPVSDLRTYEEQIDRLGAQERLFARLSGYFGVIALVLACVGLYGLLSFQLLRRTGEIGLRMALGALPGQVVRMILRESLKLIAGGVALGLLAACAASRLVAAMLFDVSPIDPVTYAAVALLLVAVALAASLLPARRATKVDPMTALRAE
jgi:predicted permease